MEPLDAAPEDERRHRHHRRRRAWWKRKSIWIILLATAVAIFLALWLISSLGSPHEVD
jgi:hypothetical protein